ncbi:MAG: hypothetical protein ACRDLT_10140 [Solirubrobacteraceae bacterium]
MPQTENKHSPQEVADAIERFDEWAETLSREDFEATDDLFAVARAADAVDAAKAALDAAVATARAMDRSWNQIAMSLGVSRQAARQRFAGSAQQDAVARQKSRRAAAAGSRSVKTQTSVTRHKKFAAISQSDHPKSTTRGSTRSN